MLTIVAVDQGIALLVVVASVGLLALLFQVLRSKPTLEPGTVRGRGSSPWMSKVRHLCAEGRSVVELTTARTPGEPGSGLTIKDLGRVERGLDLLIAQLDEAEVDAPSPLVAQSLRLASVQAENLNGLVQTERRLRLSTVHPSRPLLDATALQLSKARSSLDEALRDLSQSITDLD